MARRKNKSKQQDSQQTTSHEIENSNEIQDSDLETAARFGKELLLKCDEAETKAKRLEAELSRLQADLDQESLERLRLAQRVHELEHEVLEKDQQMQTTVLKQPMSYMRNLTASSMVERMRNLNLLDWVEELKPPSIISEPTSPILISEAESEEGLDVEQRLNNLRNANQQLRQKLMELRSQHHEQVEDLQVEIESLRDNLTRMMEKEPEEVISPVESPSPPQMIRQASISDQIKHIIQERDLHAALAHEAQLQCENLRHQMEAMERELVMTQLQLMSVKKEEDSPTTAVDISTLDNADKLLTEASKALKQLQACDPRVLHRRASTLQSSDPHWDILSTLPKQFDIQAATQASNHLIDYIVEQWKLKCPNGSLENLITELLEEVALTKQGKNETTLLWAVCLEKLASLDAEKRMIRTDKPVLIRRESFGARLFGAAKSFIWRTPSVSQRASSAVEL